MMMTVAVAAAAIESANNKKGKRKKIFALHTQQFDSLCFVNGKATSQPAGVSVLLVNWPDSHRRALCVDMCPGSSEAQLLNWLRMATGVKCGQCDFLLQCIVATATTITVPCVLRLSHFCPGPARPDESAWMMMMMIRPMLLLLLLQMRDSGEMTACKKQYKLLSFR